MNPPDHPNPNPKPDPDRAIAIEIQPASPRFSSSSPGPGPAHFSPTGGTHRKIGLPVDLSDESAFAVRWAVQNYLRPGDTVTLVHVRPTSVLYGADWGSTKFSGEISGEGEDGEEAKKKNMEDEFDKFTAGKIAELAEPLAEAKIPYRVHIVKDHDMKERLCLEIERLGLSVVIMGSRGFGASRRSSKGRLGSVSDYCVHHCFCPVVVVRFPEERESGGDGGGGEAEGSLHTVPEEEAVVHGLPPQEHLHKAQ